MIKYSVRAGNLEGFIEIDFDMNVVEASESLLSFIGTTFSETINNISEEKGEIKIHKIYKNVN
jgi:hypothetical protein